MKSTTEDRIISTVRQAITDDRHILPEVKEKLCNLFNPLELYQIGQIAAQAIAEDDRLKVVLTHKSSRQYNSKSEFLVTRS